MISPPADIVTLDRVICCYPDMEKLVELSAKRAIKIYGLVYPRDTWWVRAGLAIGNLYLRVRGSAYRTFSHPTKVVEAIVHSSGFKEKSVPPEPGVAGGSLHTLKRITQASLTTKPVRPEAETGAGLIG